MLDRAEQAGYICPRSWAAGRKSCPASQISLPGVAFPWARLSFFVISPRSPECRQRKLVGTNPGESAPAAPLQQDPRWGHDLPLQLSEIGLLRGPLTATTACTMNIEPTAWKKTRRSFPWQVRIDDTTAFKTPLGADDLRALVPLASTKMGLLPPAELSADQTSKLLDAMRLKND